MVTDELSEKIDNGDSLVPIQVDWFVPHVETIAVFVNEIVYLAMFGCNLISIKIHVTRFNHMDTKFIKKPTWFMICKRQPREYINHTCLVTIKIDQE